ncbi:phosphonopyruvate decarboxylase [Balneolaceae bacterium YR4-1]|uniref:Phosphonopyruvate decarboxylase n=1 Tax=Halalkalibaculum roseum TaxID=2709311 RepID=A0A6M1SWU8_9BACT|nr:phosphonopyruvate decarboxylase [Halalkalibaculum roseum]NGP76668.1 phosphonopyruvate decarboxylase [Halalkalibaculum roseum]
MISNKLFFQALKSNDVNFFTGVPDSLLKNFCACLTDNTENSQHLITANEGAAVALAAGYHLATGSLPFVYLQNSGLGNTINPLLSLADREVYSIPMLLMIGWRGEPGVSDEPQHKKQGRVQNSILRAIEIPFYQLNSETDNIEDFVTNATKEAKKINGPVVIVVSKNTFEPYSLQPGTSSGYSLSREDAIEYVLDKLSSDDIIVSTTGKPSREVYEYREAKGQGHQNDFLTVGSMGHCSQIALGIAMHTEQNVFCLDGDGSVIMHMGSLGIIGENAPANFKHIVLNNGAHDSVGGQPTVGFNISIPTIAEGAGYLTTFTATTKDDLDKDFERFLEIGGPALFEIRVKKGARNNLGRPNRTPVENKKELMKLLSTE